MTTAPADRIPGLIAAVTLITPFMLMGVTASVLGQAIGWPASLGDPASITLPRLIEKADAVKLGYSCYLAVAMLLVPATAAMSARLRLSPSLGGFLLTLAGMSALAKAIGICRWLFAMPELARAYVAPGADQATLSAIFEALNAYLGGIGELLGVGLISGVWTLVIGWAVIRAPGRIAKLVGGYVMLSGLGLFGVTLPFFGIEVGGLLSVANRAWLLGLAAMGVWALTTPKTAASA